MRVRPVKTIADPERVGQAGSFLTLGFRDYLAARVLLTTRLPLQGAVLASTCVEKYFKAVLGFHGNPRRGHLSDALVRAVGNCDRGIVSTLSPQFLAFLQECYRLRYRDGIELGFNLVVSTREVLAELDFTVAHMESKFEFTMPSRAERLLRRYHELVAQRDTRLLSNNHVLARVSREEFLAQPDFVYEIRLDAGRGMMEAQYHIKKSPTDRNFLREGWIPLGKTDGGEESYRLSLGADGNILTLD